MALSLTARDLVQIETVSRTLLASTAAPSVDAWRLDAAGAARALFGADFAVFGFTDGETPYVFDGLDPAVWDQFVSYVAIQHGEYETTDPVMNHWIRAQRAAGRGVFSEETMEGVLQTRGLSLRQSEILQGVARPLRLFGMRGITAPHRGGEVGLQVGSERAGLAGRAAEDDLALLGLIRPALLAGLDGLGQVHAHRAALDAISDPVAVFDADGRAVHRNAALVALLGADPEAARVEDALRGIARDVRALAFPLRADAPGALAASGALGGLSARGVATGRTAYRLRPVILPAGAYAPGPVLLVSVAAEVAPVPPTPAAIRDRLGLTLREAEVALLLAEGLTNAQTAARLFIAPATARRHTEAVLGKLGLPTRAAVAGRLAGLH